MSTDLKTVVITGASSGLGLHTAKAMARLGSYRIVLACRNDDKARNAIKEIYRDVPGVAADAVSSLNLDLTVPETIVRFADQFRTNYDGLDVLINNAGIMNHPHEMTSTGIEVHFAANYLGHFHLTKLLDDLFRPEARVINISSGFYKQATSIPSLETLTDFSATSALHPKQLYSISKLANCLHTTSLNASYQAANRSVKAVVVRPGFVRGTDLGRHTNPVLRTFAAPLIWLIAKNVDQGIEGILYCSTAQFDSLQGGALYYGNIVEAFTPTVNPDAAKQLIQISDRLLERSSETD